MKKLLTNNLGLKLLSVVAAILLWFIVVNIDDQVTYQDFSPIRVTMLNEDAVTGRDKVYKIEDNSDVISIRVWARRSVLDKLSASDFTATADMEKNIKLDNLVGIEVTCSNKNIKPADITKSRENVVISIEDASSEQFNVVVAQKADSQPGNGYVVGTAVPEQSMIQIDGPASVISRIKRVEAVLDVSGFTSDRTVRCSLRVVDSYGDEVDTTYLDYVGKTEGMDVSVTILKTKTVPVKIGYSGTPADDYSFSSISYKPETLEIAGTSEAIAAVSSVTVPEEAVNIDGITENLQMTLDITEYLPAGIRLKDTADASVAVVVEIEKKQGKTVRIPVSQIGLQNVPRGLEVDFGDLDEIEIIVMGTSAELAELSEDEIAVSLDLNKYSKSGTYTKTVDVTLPGSCSLIGETEVEFELVKASAAITNNSNTIGTTGTIGTTETAGTSGSDNASGSGGSSEEGSGMDNETTDDVSGENTSGENTSGTE